MHVSQLDDKDFDSTLAHPGLHHLVWVDFFATWCKPCQEVLKGIEDFAKKVEDMAHVFKVDTDEAGLIAQRYQIKSLPTLILFKDGKEITRVTDYIDNKDLFSLLRTITKNNAGVIKKYDVYRRDGKEVDWAFVLEDIDPLIVPALRAYAQAAYDAGQVGLAASLLEKIVELEGRTP
jgi:thioredoxin 1